VSGLELALHHAALGREILPFRLGEPSASGKRTKIPLTKWQDKATTDEATIAKWWARYPNAMPGWRLPKGTIVADLDDAAAFAATGLELPDGPSQATPSGGRHVLYTYDGDARQTVKEVDGLDSRVGGRGWVGLYSAESFAGEPTAAPAWLLMPRAAAPSAGEAVQMTTRAEITSWLGNLARAGRLTQADCAVLLERAYDDGRIYDSDAARPWPPAFPKLATDAAAWSAKDAVDTSMFNVNLGAQLRAKRVVGEAPAEREPLFRPMSDVEVVEPMPLLLGRLDPSSHTVLFGDGGTGKGVIAAWWAARLTAGGMKVGVLDYERNARFEWRPRLDAFGAALALVSISQPDRPIWEDAERIGDEARDLGIGYLVVDSVTYACMGQEVEKSVTAARYSRAIDSIGLPMLSLAHTTKADANPQHPFGSVFWSNGARLTIGVSGRGDEPRVLANRKTNQRAPFASVSIDWSWIHGDLPPSLVESETLFTLGARALDAVGDQTMTAEELLDIVNSDGGKPTSIGSLRNTLRRDGRFVKVGTDAWAAQFTSPRAQTVVHGGAEE
jgi:hypothetical protein